MDTHGLGRHTIRALEDRPLNHSTQQGSRDEKFAFPNSILKYSGASTQKPQATQCPRGQAETTAKNRTF